MGGAISALWQGAPPPPQRPGARLLAALNNFWARKQQHKKSIYFPLLLANIEAWLSQYGCTVEDNNVVVVVPKDAFQRVFARPGSTGFTIAGVKQGMLGVVSIAFIGNSHALTSYRLSFDMASLEHLGVAVLPEKTVDPLDVMCTDDQKEFRSKWGPEHTIPVELCASRVGVPVEADVDDPVALSKFDGLRAGFAMLPNADAGLARRTAHFRLVGVEKPTGELRMLRGLELAKSFYSTVMNCVIACMRYEKDGRTERAVVGTLTESTCLPMYWALIRGVKGGLSVQLAHLVTVDNIIFLLGVELKDREAELLKRPKLAAIQNRITKLKLFIKIVEEGAVSQQLKEWARVVYEANQSRWALLKNGHEEGPPKLLSAARVQCIPLICARANEVFHFFEAFGLPTTVRGCFRSGTVVDEHVFPVPTDYSVTSLCKDNRPEMGTRCVLRNGLCSVGPPGKPVHFEHRWMISYEYEARIVPRVAECLGVGVGALQAIDPGGRAFTVDTLECTAKEDGSERFKVTAKEYFKTLPDKILERTAKSGGKLSRAQISRNVRNRDIKAKQFYKKLEARIKAAKGDGKTSAAEIKAMEKQLNKRNKADVKTQVEEMAEEPAGRDGRVGEEEKELRETMAETDAAFKERLADKAARIKHDKEKMYDRAEELKGEGKDEFLGPLWTEQVEGRYQYYCGKRKENGLKVPTRRFFLKYKVEKRMRRRAKWINMETHRMVEAEQDAMLAKMIPVGTSVVLCARLNFHNFKKLSRRIKKYFSYLALASFHDRMKLRCDNVGAVLLNVNEGYTTKKCPSCGAHANVGASKTFKCPDDECEFECGRDLKVRTRMRMCWKADVLVQGAFCQIQRLLNFVRY